MTVSSLADHASRLERELARHARLRDLILGFDRGLAAAGNLASALGALGEKIDALFGGRASVWLHDRERDQLVRQCGGDRACVPADQSDSSLARALRLDQPERRGDTLLVPLRGQRRALGVLMVEALPDEEHPGESVGLAGELSRQLSAAIENKLLLEQVTRQARLDAERRAHSQKLAALGQFVAGIAHELNNPLQGVLGHLELLRRNRRLPRALAADVRLISREADRAAAIVNRLLVFAGSRRAARRPVNPNAALTRAVALRARACREAGITVIRRLDRRTLPITGDALLLQQAFLNIILNAEQAIAAKVRQAPAAPKECIEATTRARRDAVLVEIRDTGPGIPPDILPRIFEPFFTTKEVGKGTGLGLALTYGIIKEHGGSIAAQPDPRGGTVFRIELPLAGTTVGASRRGEQNG